MLEKPVDGTDRWKENRSEIIRVEGSCTNSQSSLLAFSKRNMDVYALKLTSCPPECASQNLNEMALTRFVYFFSRIICFEASHLTLVVYDCLVTSAIRSQPHYTIHGHLNTNPSIA